MADFWKSQPRKFCDFCKCWIADNKPSREFHEKGKRHQENVTKRISEIRKKGMEDAKHKKDEADWMAQMEREAMKKLREDLTLDPSLAAVYGVQIKSKSVETAEKREPSPVTGDASCTTPDGVDSWEEAYSSEGYVYYWNTVTGESRWEVPTSSSDLESRQTAETLTYSEQKKIDTKSESGCQSTDDLGVWKQMQSPEGHTYYWNTTNGEVSWELPSSKTDETVKSNDDKAGCRGTTEESSKVKEDTTVKKEKTPPRLLESPENQPSTKNADPRRKRSSVYGEWQEIKQESEPVVDLELPVSLNQNEFKTFELPGEPKIKFTERKVETLGGGSGANAVAFKKRKLNSAASRGNLRRGDDDQDT